jgi:hypothetical protein
MNIQIFQIFNFIYAYINIFFNKDIIISLELNGRWVIVKLLILI